MARIAKTEIAPAVEFNSSFTISPSDLPLRRMDAKRISLLGDGGWGTALACLLAGNGHRATLWGFFPEITAETRRLRENRKFLPGIRIPETVQLTHDLSEAVLGADLIVFSTPVNFNGNTQALGAQVRYGMNGVGRKCLPWGTG